MTVRGGDYLETISGRKFYLIDPDPDSIILEDIIHSLSLQCRFNGHCKDFYSVLEHSYHIAVWLYTIYKNPELTKQGALHDATEAYLCDVPRPVKPYLMEYKPIELGLQRAIFRKFGLPEEMDLRVHEADARMLKTERAQVMNPSKNVWGIDSLEPLPVKIRFYSPGEIRYLFKDLMNSHMTNETYSYQNAIVA